MTAVAEAANHKRMEAAVAEAVAETKKLADAVADKTRSRGKKQDMAEQLTYQEAHAAVAPKEKRQHKKKT